MQFTHIRQCEWVNKHTGSLQPNSFKIQLVVTFWHSEILCWLSSSTVLNSLSQYSHFGWEWDWSRWSFERRKWNAFGISSEWEVLLDNYSKRRTIGKKHNRLVMIACHFWSHDRPEPAETKYVSNVTADKHLTWVRCISVWHNGQFVVVLKKKQWRILFYINNRTYLASLLKHDWHCRWPHIFSCTGSRSINVHIGQMNFRSRLSLFFASKPGINRFFIDMKRKSIIDRWKKRFLMKSRIQISNLSRKKMQIVSEMRI